MNYKVNEKNTRILGRTVEIDGVRYLSYSCSAIEFEFVGTKVEAVLWTDSAQPDTLEIFKGWAAVFINDETTPSKRFCLDKEEDIYTLYESDTIKTVKIRLMKMSESAFGKIGVKELLTNGTISPTDSKERKIEFIGDSITCGYGIEGVWNTDTFTTAQENPWEAFAARTARHFNADFNCVSWSGIGIISSWTNDDNPLTDWLMPMLYQYTDIGCEKNLGKADYEIWDSTKFIAQLIVINLGTNDASYVKDIKDRIDEFGNAYYKFINQVREKNPNAQILCIFGAMGDSLYPEIEKQVNLYKQNNNDNKIHSMAMDVQLESDGIGSDWHPSMKTHIKMSEKLIIKISSIMNW